MSGTLGRKLLQASNREGAETPSPGHLAQDAGGRQIARQGRLGLRRNAQHAGERLRREHGFAQRGGDGVRQPGAAIAAGGEPGPLVGGRLQSVEFARALAASCSQSQSRSSSRRRRDNGCRPA